MKKSILILVCLLFAISVNAQQSFLNGESANNVLGQTNFASSGVGVSPTEMESPTAVAISSKGVLAVAMNARVLIWNSLPTTAGQAADLVIGQVSLFNSSTGCSQGTLNTGIGGLCFTPDGNKLIVADSDNNRVLIFDTPSSNGQLANVVIGQVDFTTNSFGVSQSTLNQPTGVFVTADGKLIICDTGNNRVLVYNSIPTNNNALADNVIGQNNFAIGNSGSSLSNFSYPSNCIVTKEGKLLVSDQFNHRILIFDDSDLSIIGPTAENFIGTNSMGTTSNDLNTPTGLAYTPDGKLFICDRNNNRVLGFNSVPTINSASADFVLGQVDFTTALTNTDVSGLTFPNGIACDMYGRAFIADNGNNRVVNFGYENAFVSDLAVNINNKSNLCIGSNFVTTITVTNNGPITANNVVIKTAIPNQFNYSSSSTSLGTYTASTGIWNLPSLASGVTRTLTINGSLTSSLTQTFSFYAAVDYTENSDNNLSNNAININVNAHATNNPVINISSTSNPSCSSTSATLMASGGTSYNWDGGPVSSNYVLSPGVSGVFTVHGSNAQGCINSALITQTVTNAPTIAMAGSDQSICGSSVVLTANTPTVGTGSWSLISGTGSITAPSNPSTSVTGITPGTNTYRWTTTTAAPCSTSVDDIQITANALPSVSIISTFSPVCFSVSTYTLTGGMPAGGIFTGANVIAGVLQTSALSGNQTVTYGYTDGNGCFNSSSETIFVEDGSQITGVVNANGSAITNGTVYLLEYNNTFLMNTIQTFTQTATNSFVFNNVAPGNYLILAQPAITGNSGAYNGSVSFWQDATAFTMDCSSTQTFTIETTTLSSLTAGSGVISGTVARGPNFGSGKTDALGDPIPGVDVSLEQNPGGIIIANTQTGSNGNYQFSNVSDGNYTVLVDIPGSGMVSSHTISLAGTENWINLDYYVDSNKVFTNPTTAPAIVGIATFKNSNISIYPNPVHNKLTISNALAIDEVTITTIAGVTVYSSKINNDANTEIDFSEMPIGVYLIELRNKNTNYRTKIIKQ
ncbi:MAG: SMP-30/gluconolactonase/LRE family protein [Bacteroidota bacterium]